MSMNVKKFSQEPDVYNAGDFATARPAGDFNDPPQYYGGVQRDPQTRLVMSMVSLVKRHAVSDIEQALVAATQIVRSEYQRKIMNVKDMEAKVAEIEGLKRR